MDMAIVHSKTLALSLLFEGPVAAGPTATITIDEDVDLRFSMGDDSPRGTGLSLNSPVFAPFPLSGFTVNPKSLFLRFSPGQDAVALKVNLHLDGPAAVLSGTATLPEGVQVTADIPGGGVASLRNGRFSLPL